MDYKQKADLVEELQQAIMKPVTGQWGLASTEGEYIDDRVAFETYDGETKQKILEERSLRAFHIRCLNVTGLAAENKINSLQGSRLLLDERPCQIPEVGDRELPLPHRKLRQQSNVPHAQKERKRASRRGCSFSFSNRAIGTVSLR